MMDPRSRTHGQIIPARSSRRQPARSQYPSIPLSLHPSIPPSFHPSIPPSLHPSIPPPLSIPLPVTLLWDPSIPLPVVFLWVVKREELVQQIRHHRHRRRYKTVPGEETEHAQRWRPPHCRPPPSIRQPFPILVLHPNGSLRDAVEEGSHPSHGSRIASLVVVKRFGGVIQDEEAR